MNELGKPIMINYRLKYSVSEVAKILEVDKQLIKNWSYHFSSYLNPNANPNKGIEREFTANDLSTLGYISMYWEENPDFENIQYGLNSNEQFEYPYSEFANEAIPFFKEFSEELIGGKAWMIGGLDEISDRLSLANSYKHAGDTLINQAIENDDYELIYPTIYSYRHATELYLKSINQHTLPKDGKIHDLVILADKFKQIIKKEFDITPPKWFENIILAFNDFDPNGTAFRYGIRVDKDEMFIDLNHIQKIMDWFSESIHRIMKEINS